MDAYILGKHAGELPVHLLQQGEPGNRVRAIGRLDGPDHNAYYALEAPDQQTVDSLVTQVKSTGTQSEQTLTVCLKPSCLGMVSHPNGNPSWMPPFLWYIFHWIHTHDAGPGVDAARKILGPEGVHAATDGEGKALIQLGSDDQAKLSAASAAISDSLGKLAGGAHQVAGADLQRA
jgi:hypothetical protein